MTAPHAIEPLSKQVTIVIGLTVVGFMAFGLTLSFYRNILFDQTLRELEAANDVIAEQIREGERDVEYYQSAQYKDKYAKENLGKLNAGEKVLIITRPAALPTIGEESATDKERREAAYQELLRQMPVQDHWRLFLFYPERLEELKRGV